MSLDRNRLKNVRDRRDGGYDSQCPACAAEGNDLDGKNHLRVYQGGAYVCINYTTGRAKAEHNKRINALAGDRGSRQGAVIPAPPPAIVRAANCEVPRLTVPDDQELDAIATSRHWNVALARPALRELANRGLLWRAWVTDWGTQWHSWVVTDSTRYAWRARRTTRHNWTDDKKTITYGKQVAGWPVGVDTISNRRLVVLCEGEADLLAAAVVAYAEGCDLSAIGFCCVNGAVELDAVGVQQFKGMRVLVARQNDVTHQKGATIAERWLQQLHDAGAGPLIATRFDLQLLPDGKQCKDMAEYAETLTGASPPVFIAPNLPPATSAGCSNCAAGTFPPFPVNQALNHE